MAKILKPGAEGEAVRAVQRTLAGRNCFVGPITGLFDEATTRAVRLFQGWNEIAETGEVNAATREALFGVSEPAEQADGFPG